MKTYYAASTNGFYTDSLHGRAVPADAAEITPETHRALMRSQAEGKAIRPGEDGRPVATDRPAYAPTVQDRIARLEAEATPRRLREAALGADNGWLRELDGRIAALRAKPPA